MSTNSTKPYYLAGPMSGIPQFNYPKFFKVAKILRDAGYLIHSPAEMDSPEVLEKILASPDGKLDLNLPSWGDFLSKDVKFVADCAAGVIAMDGWDKSRGARLEVFVANQCKHPILRVDGNGTVTPLTEGEYIRGILGYPADTAVFLGSNYAKSA